MADRKDRLDARGLKRRTDLSQVIVPWTSRFERGQPTLTISAGSEVESVLRSAGNYAKKGLKSHSRNAMSICWNRPSHEACVTLNAYRMKLILPTS